MSLGTLRTSFLDRAFFPRVTSSCFRSSRRGLVEATHPSPGWFVSSMLWREVCMPVYWSHAARRSHMLTTVSFQFLASASCMSSSHVWHSQNCLALARDRRVMALVVSSCFIHLAMCAWSVWLRMGIGVGYCRRPSSVGPTKGREAVDFGRCHVSLGTSRTSSLDRVFFPRVISSCFRSSRRGLVAVAHPSPGWIVSSKLWKEVCMPVYWSHAARRRHMLPTVSSQFLASASWMNSVHVWHSQDCLALARARCVMTLVVSSCFMHLTRCAWSV